MVDFGKNLRGYVQGIIAAADFKINTSVLEGVNNKIKQIKRRAYGFRGSSSKILFNKEANGYLSCVTVKSPREPKLKRVFEELPRDDLYFFLKVKAAFHGLPR